MTKALNFKLAETFKAPQGEGSFMGVQMCFLRFAGCPVGDYARKTEYTKVPSPTNANLFQWLMLHPDHSVCQAAHSDIPFPCDTNYKAKHTMTVEELAVLTRDVQHICLTGGEPLAYPNLPVLIDALNNDWMKSAKCDEGKIRMWHVETSGTIPIEPFFDQVPLSGDYGVWVVCAPKVGFLASNVDAVDELKFVVSHRSEAAGIVRFLNNNEFTRRGITVWLQPVGDLKTTPQASYDNCLWVQEELMKHNLGNLEIRVGIQLHKILGTR